MSSIWKVVEIAMACVQIEAGKRPTMVDICNDLTEAIRMGENYEFSSNVTGETLSYSNVQPRWGLCTKVVNLLYIHAYNQSTHKNCLFSITSH